MAAPQISKELLTIFTQEVHHIFANTGGRLDGVCRMKAVQGNTVKFPKMGQTTTREHNIGSDIVATDIAHDPVTLTLKNYSTGYYTDIFTNSQINFDDRREAATEVANALARRRDQLIIDALVAETTVDVVPINISGANAGQTLSALIEAKRLLDLNAVGGRMVMLQHVNSMHELLKDDKITSADYASLKALVGGSLNAFYGFEFINYPNMPAVEIANGVTGLPLTTPSGGFANRSNFAFTPSAVGCGYSLTPRVSIDWIPEKAAWFVSGILSGAAKVIDATGVKKVLTREVA